MTIRLEQMHPVLAHLPVALLPFAVAADCLGAVRDDDALRAVGRTAMGAAAIGAVLAAGSGLIAGEEVNEGEARDMLMTHRNLNAVVTATALGMASSRARTERPGALYLATGIAAVGLLGYTAYLGGKMVYGKGVGVKPAGGVYRPGAPTMRVGQLGAFFATALVDLFHGLRHMVSEVSNGKIAPWLTDSRRPGGGE